MPSSPDENRSPMAAEMEKVWGSGPPAVSRPGEASRLTPGPSSRAPIGTPVVQALSESSAQETSAALARIPGGKWVMTAQLDGKRGGVLVKSVSGCADEPPLVTVAAWKGHGIEPMIRDSRHFCLCLIDPEDRLLARKFTGHLSDHADQFDSLPTQRLVSAPALKRCRPRSTARLSATSTWRPTTARSGRAGAGDHERRPRERQATRDQAVTGD